MKHFIDKALEKGCSEAETYMISKQTQGLFFVNNEISDLQSKESTGLALRIKKNNRLGFIGSSNLLDAGEVVNRAVESSEYGDEMAYSFPNQANYSSLDIYNDDFAKKPVEEFIPRCEEFIKIIRSATKNITVDCNFEKTATTIHLVNSNGLEAEYRKVLLTFYTEMRLTEGTSSLELEMQYDAHNTDIDEKRYAEQIAYEIPFLLKRTSIKAGKRQVIFSPDCFGDLFMALETGLRGDAVVKGVSPLKEKLGQQIFDERFTVIDDSTNIRGKMAAPFDDEGTPGQRTYLVRNGVLENYICDLKAANALGCQPTGNGLRSKGIYRVKSYGQKPICDFSNVLIQPGKMTLDEMIESIDEGVLVEAIGGLLLANLTNGDFSGSIGQGLKIENGKIVGRVTNAMLSGNFYTDFKDNLVDFSSETFCQGAFSGQIGSFDVGYAYLKDITVASR